MRGRGCYAVGNDDAASLLMKFIDWGDSTDRHFVASESFVNFIGINANDVVRLGTHFYAEDVGLLKINLTERNTTT